MNNKQVKFFQTKKKELIRYKLVRGRKPIAIIFFHGFMSDLTGKKIKLLSKFCSKQNVPFLTFEYSGHGKSSGTITNYGIKDWIEQSKEIIESTIKTKNIILIGSSMGAWIAASLIQKIRKNIKGFIGIASAPDFTKKIMWERFSEKTKSMINKGIIYNLPSSYGNFYPISKKLILSGNNSLILHKKIKCNFPIRLFHGLNDKSVGKEFSIQLLKTFLSKDKIIFLQKNGDHSLSSKEDFKKITGELIKLIKYAI